MDKEKAIKDAVEVLIQYEDDWCATKSNETQLEWYEVLLREKWKDWED